jgi:hypothetical protein
VKSKTIVESQMTLSLSFMIIFSLSACDGSMIEGQGRSKQISGKDTCSSSATNIGVKTAIFQKSRESNPSSESRISDLEKGSVSRLEQPVVDQIDNGTEKVTCSATLVMSLPPGSKAQKNIDEQQKIRIRYSVQAAADGNGMVYEVFGTESLATALAGKSQSSLAKTMGVAAAASPKNTKTGLHYVTGLNPNGDNWLALKAEPNLQSRRVAQLGPDTLLVTDGTRIGQWLKVETLEGQYGWAAAKYIACCR